MKDLVKDMYDQIRMPEDCVYKIRKAMAEEKLERPILFKRLGTVAAAMAAAFLMLLVTSPEVRAAVEDLVVTYIFPDSGITIYEETDEEGEITRVVALDTESPTFAKVREGRLYFTGNGENIDITDQITEEEPYYYTYTDEYGLLHYMVVGYSGEIENFGVYEFFREDKEEQKDWEGWSNGYGRNFLDPTTGKCYPWVERVWEDLNVPWPKPGA